VIPTKTVHCFRNNKTWVTKDIKASLNRKKAAFRSGDKEEMKKVQKELRENITEGKECYRRKLERKHQQKNLREVWSGMRTITGHGAKTIHGREGNLDEANELNLFFNRFDDVAPLHPPPSSSCSSSPLPPPSLSLIPLLPSLLPSCSLHSPLPPLLSPGPITITVEDVRSELGRLRPGKAAGLTASAAECSRCVRLSCAASSGTSST